MTNLANELGNSKMTRKRRGWPPKRRARQAEIIRKTRPWRKSTGPRSKAGKASSKMNALKHGFRDAGWRALRKALTDQRRFLKTVNAALELLQQERKHTLPPPPLPVFLSSLHSLTNTYPLPLLPARGDEQCSRDRDHKKSGGGGGEGNKARALARSRSGRGGGGSIRTVPVFLDSAIKNPFASPHLRA